VNGPQGWLMRMSGTIAPLPGVEPGDAEIRSPGCASGARGNGPGGR
jgi:hypothetical protein